MWTNFITRLALFVSVIFTLALVIQGGVTLAMYYQDILRFPMHTLAAVIGYPIVYLIGVATIYSIAWVLTGKRCWK